MSSNGQPMPDRAGDVAAIVNAGLELFAQGDAGRLELLKRICAVLNTHDFGAWGLLEKPGPRIPADIIVWHPTLDHVDVLSDGGPVWIPRGTIAEDWRWILAPPPGEPPPPPPPPPIGRAYDEGLAREFAIVVDECYRDARRTVDGGGTIFATRAAFDYYTGRLDWAASRDKHRAELRAALGL
jgi:hypothetical protein